MIRLKGSCRILPRSSLISLLWCLLLTLYLLGGKVVNARPQSMAAENQQQREPSGTSSTAQVAEANPANETSGDRYCSNDLTTRRNLFICFCSGRCSSSFLSIRNCSCYHISKMCCSGFPNLVQDIFDKWIFSTSYHNNRGSKHNIESIIFNTLDNHVKLFIIVFALRLFSTYRGKSKLKANAVKEIMCGKNQTNSSALEMLFYSEPLFKLPLNQSSHVRMCKGRCGRASTLKCRWFLRPFRKVRLLEYFQCVKITKRHKDKTVDEESVIFRNFCVVVFVNSSSSNKSNRRINSIINNTYSSNAKSNSENSTISIDNNYNNSCSSCNSNYISNINNNSSNSSSVNFNSSSFIVAKKMRERRELPRKCSHANGDKCTSKDANRILDTEQVSLLTSVSNVTVEATANVLPVQTSAGMKESHSMGLSPNTSEDASKSGYDLPFIIVEDADSHLLPKPPLTATPLVSQDYSTQVNDYGVGTVESEAGTTPADSMEQSYYPVPLLTHKPSGSYTRPESSYYEYYTKPITTTPSYSYVDENYWLQIPQLPLPVDSGSGYYNIYSRPPSTEAYWSGIGIDIRPPPAPVPSDLHLQFPSTPDYMFVSTTQSSLSTITGALSDTPAFIEPIEVSDIEKIPDSNKPPSKNISLGHSPLTVLIGRPPPEIVLLDDINQAAVEAGSVGDVANDPEVGPMSAGAASAAGTSALGLGLGLAGATAGAAGLGIGAGLAATGLGVGLGTGLGVGLGAGAGLSQVGQQRPLNQYRPGEVSNHLATVAPTIVQRPTNNDEEEEEYSLIEMVASVFTLRFLRKIMEMAWSVFLPHVSFLITGGFSVLSFMFPWLLPYFVEPVTEMLSTLTAARHHNHHNGDNYYLFTEKG